MNNSTITRCVLVTLLAFHFGSVCGTAQDASPVRDEAKPVETTQPPAATTAVDPLAASQMPDISGTWGVKIVEPKEMSSILGEMEIRRVQNGATDFLIDQPWVVRPRRVSVRWSDARQRFEGEWKEDESGKQSKITLLPLADKMKLRVIISSRIPTAKQSVDSDGSKENETKQFVTQEWTRTSSSLSTTFDKNNAAYRQLTAAVSTDDSDETMTHADAPAKAVQTKVFTLANCSAVECGKLLKVFFDDRGVTWDTRTNSIVVVSADEERMKAIEAILLRLDEAPSTPAVPKTDAAISFTSAAAPSSSGIPNTPAAKQLVEQLGAQESAAAAEAATIRQLQANGQAEQNRQPIAEHQRNLKNLLSTAFDLKLQWEELQVKELQSRLSRLERQIGQRKELREKIIARRGAELIEGAVLKWNPDGSSPNQTADSRTNGDKSATSDVVRSSSTDQSYQEFAKKLGTMNSSVAEAEEALSRAERDAGSDLVIDTVPRARRRFEEAIRNKKAIQYEYAAVLRDLELQIESAQAEVDAAKKIADYDQQLVEQRVSPLRKLEDAQLRLKQATLMLERLKVKHNLYKKAGEGLAADDPLNPKLSKMIVIDRPLDAEAGAKLVWEKLGLRLKVAELTPQPIRVPAFYRSGLLVLDVRDKSPAQTCGILKGDILVSWSIWQTPSLEKLLWILKLQETDPQPELTEDGQYWVVREAKMETGFLYIEVPTEAKPKED